MILINKALSIDIFIGKAPFLEVGWHPWVGGHVKVI